MAVAIVRANVHVQKVAGSRCQEQKEGADDCNRVRLKVVVGGGEVLCARLTMYRTPPSLPSGGTGVHQSSAARQEFSLCVTVAVFLSWLVFNLPLLFRLSSDRTSWICSHSLG